MSIKEKIGNEVISEQSVNPTQPEKDAYFLRSQEEIEARDRNILDALDKMLERHTPPGKQTEESAVEKFAVGVVRKGAGIVSLAITLIFMGIVVICCFFADEPDYLLPMKLAPLSAIFLGLELFVYHITSGRKFRIHIPAILITALIIAGGCTMAVVLNDSYENTRAQYNNRTIASEIYERGYYELRHVADIKRIEVEVDLNPDGAARIEGIESLSPDDTVILTVTFSGTYNSPAAFAEECKKVIDAYRFLGIPVTDFHFISDSRLSSFRLNVIGRFMQDYFEDDLIEEITYFYIDDFDYIEDLQDIPVETEDAAETVGI